MKIKLTPALQRLFQAAAGDQNLPEEVRQAAARELELGGGAAADWATVKSVVQHSRQLKGADAVPPLDQLCRGGGGGIAFPEPRRREGGMPLELQRRLQELRARLEQAQYDAMVADVTQAERAAAAAREGGLVTYKQQISFGVHVLAVMAAFYAFGHVAGMAMSSNKALHPLVGLVFMIIAMLLETVLFIIRSTVPPKLHQAAARRAVAARVARQQERLKQQLGARERGAEGEVAGESRTTVPAGGWGSQQEGGSGSQPERGSAMQPPLPSEQKGAAEKKDD